METSKFQGLGTGLPLEDIFWRRFGRKDVSESRRVTSPLEFLWLTVDDIENHASESSRSQDARICKCSGQTACLKGLNGVVSPKKNNLDVARS